MQIMIHGIPTGITKLIRYFFNYKPQMCGTRIDKRVFVDKLNVETWRSVITAPCNETDGRNHGHYYFILGESNTIREFIGRRRILARKMNVSNTCLRLGRVCWYFTVMGWSRGFFVDEW